METPNVLEPGTRERQILLVELWSSVRPYLLCLLEDWLIAVALWALLWAFHQLTHVTPIKGWAGTLILNIHAAGTVMAYGVFVGMFLWDIFEIRIDKARRLAVKGS